MVLRFGNRTIRVGSKQESKLREQRNAGDLLETLLLAARRHNIFDDVEAIIVGREMVYWITAEGLILDEILEPIEPNLFHGRIFLLGRVWHLLVRDEIYVSPESCLTEALVNSQHEIIL